MLEESKGEAFENQCWVSQSLTKVGMKEENIS